MISPLVPKFHLGMPWLLGEVVLRPDSPAKLVLARGAISFRTSLTPRPIGSVLRTEWGRCAPIVREVELRVVQEAFPSGTWERDLIYPSASPLYSSERIEASRFVDRGTMLDGAANVFWPRPPPGGRRLPRMRLRRGIPLALRATGHKGA